MKTICISMFACIIFYSTLLLIPHAIEADPFVQASIAVIITIGMVSLVENLLNQTIDFDTICAIFQIGPK